MDNKRELDLIQKGKACFDRSEYDKAQTIFSEVIESNIRSIDAFFYLANIFYIRGEIGKAITAFTKVLEIDPGHTDAAISLSVLYNDIGKYDEAKKIFDQASARVKSKSSQSGPNDPHINKKFAHRHYELADLYMSYNRFDEALFEYNKAIGLDPSLLDARIKLAKVLAKKGLTSKSIEELKRLRNENPGFLPARLALGVLYYAHGKVVEAQNEWQSVLAKEPSHNEAQMYLNLSKTATETSL